MTKILWCTIAGLGIVSAAFVYLGAQHFTSSDWVALLAASLVAAAQLAIVYVAIDPISKKFHRERWEPARREFFAGTLSLAQTLCRPLAHYVVLLDDCPTPRENIRAALLHVSDKSRSFDTMIEIYSLALEPEEVVQASQIADELREAGVNAEVAARSWGGFETDLPIRQESTESDKSFRVYFNKSLRRVRHSGDVRINWGDKEDRAHFLFCYNLLSVADDVSRLSKEMLDLSNAHYDCQALNQSRVFSRLVSRSDGSESAGSYIRYVKRDADYLRKVCTMIEKHGIRLLKLPEFDNKAPF